MNPETLERESAALACRRMKGKHTYDVLARAINSVFSNITSKIKCAVQQPIMDRTLLKPFGKSLCFKYTLYIFQMFFYTANVTFKINII